MRKVGKYREEVFGSGERILSSSSSWLVKKILKIISIRLIIWSNLTERYVHETIIENLNMYLIIQLSSKDIILII